MANSKERHRGSPVGDQILRHRINEDQLHRDSKSSKHPSPAEKNGKDLETMKPSEESEKPIKIEPNANGTVLILSPRAHAVAGAGGTAIAKPVSTAVVARREDRVIFKPVVSAIAGPGGIAIAEPEFIIKRRLEHRGGDDDIHSTGEVVEASEVVVANSGDKSIAQSQPVGVATAGQGGVAVSSPLAVAVVAPGGLAIARPISVAVAGPGADNPGIFLKPEGGDAPPTDGDGSEDGMPDVEEPDEEKPPQAMFYTPYAPTYLVYYTPIYEHFPIF